MWAYIFYFMNNLDQIKHSLVTTDNTVLPWIAMNPLSHLYPHYALSYALASVGTFCEQPNGDPRSTVVELWTAGQQVDRSSTWDIVHIKVLFSQVFPEAE